jgi:hypothetical protein
MVRIDGYKIQEIKDYHSEQSKREIAKAINDPETDELKDDDIEAIKNKWKYMSNQQVQKLLDINPERLYKLGFAHQPNGWRAGYTKPTLASRVAKRRAKNKIARVSRKINRRK